MSAIERISSLLKPDISEELSRLDAESREALSLLLEQATIEVFPAKGVEEQVRILPKETRIAVTCPPREGGIDTTLRFTEKLVKEGFQPTPHISARLIPDEEYLGKILQRLEEQNIKEIFVIGGDSEVAVGEFDSSFTLLSAIAGLGSNFEEVGIASYPESHSKIDDDILLQALHDKKGLASYMVTQMCFDAGVIKEWIGNIREKGIELPVHIGISGPSDIISLLKFAKRCGVGDSARFLKSHSSLIGKLLRPDYSPDRLVLDLTPYDNIQGFHIYTFNQVEKTEIWRSGMLKYINQLRK